MTNKSKYMVFITAIVTISTILIVMIPLIIYGYNFFFTETVYEMGSIGWGKQYSETLQIKSSEENILSLGEVFDFDWDKGYVIGTNFDDIIALRRQYGSFFCEGSGFGPGKKPRYIVFIKSDQFLCVHIRTTDDFIITNEEVVVTKQTKLKALGNNEYEFIEGFEYYEFEYIDPDELDKPLAQSKVEG